MIDYIVIGILVVIIAAAAFYVYKAKKERQEVYRLPGWMLLQFQKGRPASLLLQYP